MASAIVAALPAAQNSLHDFGERRKRVPTRTWRHGKALVIILRHVSIGDLGNEVRSIFEDLEALPKHACPCEGGSRHPEVIARAKEQEIGPDLRGACWRVD